MVCGVEGWQLPGMPRVPGISDLVSQLQSQTEALAQLPLTVAALNNAVQGLIEAVAITRETAASAQRVSERLEEVIEELDEPVRALRPGLERVAKVLDDPVIDTVPETLRKLTDDVVPLVHGLRDAQNRVVLVLNQAANASARLADLPGAQLFRRRSRRADGEMGEAGEGAPARREIGRASCRERV
jgi:ABC-type transporter Mla subunit MlaD